MEKLHPTGHATYPSANIHISQQLVQASQSKLTHKHILDQETQLRRNAQFTLSWLQYVQYAADLLTLIS